MNKRQRFDLFKRECLKWIDFWGLFEWNIFFDEECEDDKLASSDSSLEGMQTSLSINLNVEGKHRTEKQIKDSAFHEAAELLLAPLNILAKSRYVASAEIEQARHEIINRIQKKVF